MALPIPTGWTATTLGDAFRWGSGGTPLTSEARYYGGEIPWVTISDLSDGPISETKTKITEAGLENSNAKWVEPGSVLVALYGSIGKLGIARKRLTTNQAIAFTNPAPHLPEYVFWWLKWKRPYLNSLGQGGTQRNISQTILKKVPIFLPPLPNQRLIVEALESNFAMLDHGVSSIRAARQLISLYRTSLLVAACNGSLIRADPSRWAWRKVGDLALKIEYGTSARCVEDSIGVPILRMGNLQEGRIVLTDLKYLPLRHSEFPRLLLQDGDVLFNRTNSPELVGKTAVYRRNPPTCSFASYLLRVRLNDEMFPEFLTYCTNSPLGRAWVKSVVTQQVGQANVNGTKLRNFLIPVPPMEEQRKIVTEVEKGLSLADTAGAELSRLEIQSERLQQSVLTTAFNGDLIERPGRSSGCDAGV